MTARVFSIVREGEIVIEPTGAHRARVRLGPPDAVEAIGRMLAEEVFEQNGPNVVEALLRDDLGREVLVEVRRFFGKSAGQLRREAVERAEAAEKELALARVRIAKLEQALATRDGAS